MKIQLGQRKGTETNTKETNPRGVREEENKTRRSRSALTSLRGKQHRESVPSVRPGLDVRSLPLTPYQTYMQDYAHKHRTEKTTSKEFDQLTRENSWKNYFLVELFPC